MSRVSKMPLKNILKETNLILRENDIFYFCDDINIAQKFIEEQNKGINKMTDVAEFLIQNEQYINKEKLVLILILNYQDNLNNIREQIINLTKAQNEIQNTEELAELAKLQFQLQEQSQRLKKTIELGKGIESVLTFYYYDERQNKYIVDVTEAEELIKGQKPSNAKALKRFDEIDLSFKSGDLNEKFGMEYVLQSLLLTDLYEVFPNISFGNDIRTMILENETLKEGRISRKDLEELKQKEKYEEYARIIDNVDFQKLLPDLKESLREYAKYINIDKLLLISAYRFNEGLENGYIEEKAVLSANEILKGILINIKDKGVHLNCELQTKKDNTYEMVTVEYSIKDIKKCLSKFTKRTYITTQEIEKYKEQIKSKEINLAQISEEKIDIIFSKEELEKISIMSAENLMYVYKKNKWEPSKIIEIYQKGDIPLDYIREIKETINLSEYINFEELNKCYEELKENPENINLTNKYNSYLNLYKEVLLADKSEEEIQNQSNKTIETIVENFNEEEYNELAKKYFREGILTFNSIAEWSNETFITSLLNEGLISLEDIAEMVKEQKISFDYISNIYLDLIKNVELEYDERLKLIKKGFVRKDDIIGLYIDNLLFENDLKELAKEGFVETEEVKKIINSRTMEELEKNSSIKLLGLNRLTKRNNEIYSDHSYTGRFPEKKKGTKLLIDPNERAEFIHLLKAQKAETDLTEESPFYNYEFYVVPDESGKIGLNSVVIAERYYEDKDTQSKFATENATYFFKYKDLMVLSNLKKSEMTKERSNIVFTANHVMANEKRNGYWARSVIDSFIKTMLSSDLKEYSKENQKLIILQKLKDVYTREEIMGILQMAERIDAGEYICEIEPIDFDDEER